MRDFVTLCMMCIRVLWCGMCLYVVCLCVVCVWYGCVSGMHAYYIGVCVCVCECGVCCVAVASFDLSGWVVL